MKKEVIEMANHQHVWVLVSQDDEKCVYRCAICGELKIERR